MLITQQQGVLAQQILLQFLLLVDLILYSILWLSWLQLVSSPIDLPLTDFFRFHFLFLPCPFFGFSAPLSSAPACWRARNHVCTTPCQLDQIHAAVSCHLRTKRDRSLLSYLSRISGGRISNSIYNLLYGFWRKSCLAQHLQWYILSLHSILWIPHMKYAWTADKWLCRTILLVAAGLVRARARNSPTLPPFHT